MLDEAVDYYRKNFRPSEWMAAPYVIVGVNIFAADSNEEADLLASSHRQLMLNLHMSRLGLLPRPVEDCVESLPETEHRVLEEVLAVTVAGDQQKVRA
ncbi:MULTISPECIES: LLM class oxidoreductase [Achromobacter]|jgi:alkanesulfonate monooxygenase SsuD/methylene tetrahydromethanopterin reductase-like flavin-dependent oxidoreductase (luciferase family)|uniref:Uncharacterized protein n=1 Tax=Achromobacter mucicolens TaxID=1389922 RepID=A0ABM8LJZ4_9BURK|nr:MULTISPECIES: hypothetical protein [Achromobacter]CAB3848705.1 hypothetical protein LMG3410_01656 [Achromobacter aegrifaciens]CAB3911421.1 hypothetical protein LMG3415_04991 [Achromobacter mucicolens]